MNPAPGQYIALVTWGNHLLEKHESPPDLLKHPTFQGFVRARFHLMDGGILETPNAWLEHLEEFHARRLCLVKFRVLDASAAEHIRVMADLSGVWGIQVESPNEVQLWLAGNEGDPTSVTYRGQPIPSPIAGGPTMDQAKATLGRVFGEAISQTQSTRQELVKQGLNYLMGAAPPASTLNPPSHPVEAQQLGWAAHFGWIVTNQKWETPALLQQLQEAVVEATLAATNA